VTATTSYSCDNNNCIALHGCHSAGGQDRHFIWCNAKLFYTFL